MSRLVLCSYGKGSTHVVVVKNQMIFDGIFAQIDGNHYLRIDHNEKRSHEGGTKLPHFDLSFRISSRMNDVSSSSESGALRRNE
jgi:hypothetical protein